MIRQAKLIIILTLFSLKTQAQTLVDVAENTFKVGAFKEEVFYFGFAEGDQMIFNFTEVNGKELKEIEITELPSSSKFMDYKTKKIENKTINISRTGIYKFRLSNSAMSGRICKVKIQRIPSVESTKNFNTSVYFRTIQDTTYTPNEERFLIKSDTLASEIYSSTPKISSKNALNGNKNYQIVDFMLPPNTISWSFYIGTGEQGKKEFDKAKESFTKSAAISLIKMTGYGALEALALTGVSYFNKAQAGANVKYRFIADAYSVDLFNAGQTYYQYKQGDVINEASQMKYPLKGKIYLAIINDNTIEPILVTLKVAVIQVNQEWETRTVQIMKIKNREEPYLKH